MDVQSIVATVLISVDAFIGIIIVIIVLLQGGKIRGIGSAITGTSDSALFERLKRSGSERFSTKITWFLCTCFLVFTLLIIILIKHHVITFS